MSRKGKTAMEGDAATPGGDGLSESSDNRPGARMKPPGLKSKNHAITNVSGNPAIAATTRAVIAQSGKCNGSNVTSPTCSNIHATTV